MSANAIRPEAAADLGRLVLRVSLGALILLHGIAKIVAGPGAITGFSRRRSC